MISTVTKIQLISEKGCFSFTNYSSLLDFDKNNWKNLGDDLFVYKVFREYEDGTKTEVKHEGINASYFLSVDILGEE